MMKQLKINNPGISLSSATTKLPSQTLTNSFVDLNHCDDNRNYLVTVKPVQDNHSWDHSKVAVLDRWSSYKTPLQNDHKPNLVVVGRFLLFILTVNVL